MATSTSIPVKFVITPQRALKTNALLFIRRDELRLLDAATSKTFVGPEEFFEKLSGSILYHTDGGDSVSFVFKSCVCHWSNIEKILVERFQLDQIQFCLMFVNHSEFFSNLELTSLDDVVFAIEVVTKL